MDFVKRVDGLDCPYCPKQTVCSSTHLQNTHLKFAVHFQDSGIDRKRGVYFTAKDLKSQWVPIHVCKSTSNQTISCEVDTCCEFMSIAERSGQPGKECVHLCRVQNATNHPPPALLNQTTLEEMVNKGLVSTARSKECLELEKKAGLDGTLCVYPVFFADHGFSGRFVYYSVFIGKTDSWCLFGRTWVSFDNNTGHQSQDDEIKEAGSGTAHDFVHTEAIHVSEIEKMTNYLFKKKRIPENIDGNWRVQPDVPVQFEPS
ncbi:uncharacterized protein LOC134039038 [Osmerus eperlanus]|uniref:uncharacterized protein LOC134039038 n=1 Tax=Osmerus eperlanus TaxID=29151 RepID=UPI002E0F6658